MKRIKRETTVPIMRRDITYIQGVQLEEAVETIRHCSFTDEEMEVKEKVLRNPEDFKNAYMDWIRYWNFERCLSELHENTGKESFYYYGNCAVCNSPQPFIVDYQAAEEENGKKKINWRERLVCPNCGCNSRQRFIIHKIFDNYRPGMGLLMYEQVTDVFRRVNRDIAEAIGFEYAGNTVSAGNYNGIDCADICNLPYKDEEFGLLVSNDVFEQTSNYQQAFAEAYRVLKPGGRLLFTVPFDGNNNETVASTAQWYRANPVPDMQPLRVQYIFGWDILEALRTAGFSDACGKVYYGLKEGYMGYLPLYFEASK